MREQSRKMKEMNDRRAAEEERKQLEMEARAKLEKQLAKAEPGSRGAGEPKGRELGGVGRWGGGGEKGVS